MLTVSTVFALIIAHAPIRALPLHRNATKRIAPQIPVESQPTILKSMLIIKAEPTVTRMLMVSALKTYTEYFIYKSTHSVHTN